MSLAVSVTSLVDFLPLQNTPPHSPFLSHSFLYHRSVELSINASDADGYTALHYAQSTDLEEVAMVSWRVHVLVGFSRFFLFF
jgi:hypothetical protein